VGTVKTKLTPPTIILKIPLQRQQEIYKRTPLSLLISLLQGCCYIMVDFAIAASQNVFSTYNLFLHTKTNIIQKMTNTLDLLLQTPFCDAAVAKSTFV
jgi:hypothetical protein